MRLSLTDLLLESHGLSSRVIRTSPLTLRNSLSESDGLGTEPDKLITWAWKTDLLSLMDSSFEPDGLRSEPGGLITWAWRTRLLGRMDPELSVIDYFLEPAKLIIWVSWTQIRDKWTNSWVWVTQVKSMPDSYHEFDGLNWRVGLTCLWVFLTQLSESRWLSTMSQEQWLKDSTMDSGYESIT